MLKRTASWRRLFSVPTTYILEIVLNYELLSWDLNFGTYHLYTTASFEHSSYARIKEFLSHAQLTEKNSENELFFFRLFSPQLILQFTEGYNGLF